MIWANGLRFSRALKTAAAATEATTAATMATGRHYGQAPHIDSICRIYNCRATEGEFINCRVTGMQDYDLLVEQIDG